MIQVIFTGNLGKDAEVKTLPSGKTITNLNVGTTPRIKRNGEWQDGETIWFQVTVWYALPEIVFCKGKTVQVIGSLTKESYEKDGVKRESFKVDATSVASVLKREPHPSDAVDKSEQWALPVVEPSEPPAGMF